MFSIGIPVHFLLGIVFVYPTSGSSFPATEECENVGGETICYFKSSEEIMTWKKAKQLCNSFNSSLPVIRNKEDHEAVAGYLKSHLSNSAAWTAGRNFTYSDWTWINGDPLKSTVQVKLEENEEQFGEDDYAALEVDLNFTALAASSESPYICQYKGADCSSSSDIIVTDNGCLRMINDNRMWYDARNQCLVTNGDLAIIDDEVYGLLKEVALDQKYWIGLRKKSWRWILNDDVDSDDEIRYTNWDNAFSTTGECISIDTFEGKWKAVACNELRTVVCERAVSEESKTDGSKRSTPESLMFAAVGAGIAGLIIICIIVIIVFVLRSKQSDHSKISDGSAQSNREETDSRITSAIVNTSDRKPGNVPVNRSDKIRGAYAQIPLLTPEQTEGGEANEQSGIVYTSLEFNEDPTNVEPDKAHPTSSPTEVGPLEEIYAIPDANGQDAGSPGYKSSSSNPVRVTSKGEVVYANLQTESSGKEDSWENHDGRK